MYAENISQKNLHVYLQIYIYKKNYRKSFISSNIFCRDFLFIRKNI